MLLSARILNDVGNVNSFEYSLVAEFTVGDAVSIFLQLIDASLDKPNQGFVPPGRRYMPDSGATLQVIAESIDDAKTVTRYAVQPFAEDPSIWRLDLSASDTINGTANLRLRLSEGGVITTGLVKNALRISSDSCL